MGVPFKKIARKDPRKADAVAKFYPQLVTLGDNATLDDIAYVMKEKSSLTLGDIQSVLTNFVEAMITTLYSGQSVNIKNFGVFSLSARTAGVLDVKECTAKNIKAVKINFRPSSTVRRFRLGRRRRFGRRPGRKSVGISMTDFTTDSYVQLLKRI